MAMILRKKILVFFALTVAVSMLAMAGKLIADKRKPGPVAPALPAAREEYAKLMQKFMARDSVIHLAGNISLYDGEQPGAAKENSSFECWKAGNSLYSRFSYQQTLCNGKFLVQLDTLHKLISITGAPRDGGASGLQSPTAMFDRLFSDTASFRVSGTVTGDDKERSLQIISDFNPEIQYFTLQYSPVDYSLHSAEIRFWKNGWAGPDSTANRDKVWISRISYRQAPVKDQDIDRMMDGIFHVRKNAIEPTTAYRDYKVLINNQQ